MRGSDGLSKAFEAGLAVLALGWEPREGDQILVTRPNDRFAFDVEFFGGGLGRRSVDRGEGGRSRRVGLSGAVSVSKPARPFRYERTDKTGAQSRGSKTARLTQSDVRSRQGRRALLREILGRLEGSSEGSTRSAVMGDSPERRAFTCAYKRRMGTL